MKHYSTGLLLAILSPMIFVFAFGLDIYIPVVPKMMQILHTTQGKVQTTLSIYMLMIGLGQLFFGPLSDQIGRKKVALMGSIFYLIGSIACTAATSINFLIFARFLQGVGACASMVTCFAIARDLFEGEKAGQMFSYLTACISVSPILAPALGAYLDEIWGWRSNFLVLSVIALLGLILVTFCIQETLAVSKRLPFNWKIFLRYFEIVKNKNFFLYGLSASITMMIFFTWFASSSIIIITLLKVPEIHYGYYFGILGVVFLLGNILAGKVVPCFGIHKVVIWGASLGVIGGIVMLLDQTIFGLTLTGFFIPMNIYGIAGALILGSSAAGALESMGKMAGSASAVLGCAEFFLASTMASVLLHWKIESTFPLATLMTIGSALTFILLVRHAKK